jgi:putative ABC transport system permease protein
MSALFQDLRVALRSFAKSPTFTVVVVVTLALGIGANVAIFGLLDQLLIRPLPVESPERLVVLDAPGPYSGSTHNQSDVLTPLSHEMFRELRDRNEIFSGVLGHYPASIHLTVGGKTEDAEGDLVSGTFFDVLGVKPAVGRLLTPEDDVTPGAHPLVVLGYSYWSRRFGARPDVVGETVLVNGHPMTIVGVCAKGFYGVEVGDSVDVYVPIMMQPQIIPTWRPVLEKWDTRWLTVMARLRKGTSIDQARAGVNVLYRQLLRADAERLETKSEDFRKQFAEKNLVLLPGARGTSGLRDSSGTALVVLMGMVGLVLFIACANVANLLLARASSRRKELALRIALGASRAQLVRQLLVESMLLALAGGALGILVAIWTGDLLLRALPLDRVSQVFSADPDLRITLFAFVVSLLTGLLFGIAPCLESTRPAVAPTLKNDAATVSARAASSRFRNALVVAQVALSLLLLIGAGLFGRSLFNLVGLDPGFDPGRLLAFDVDPSLNGYDVPRRLEILRRIRDKIEAEPAVRSVSLAEVALLTDSTASSTVRVEGYESKEGENMNPNFNGVAPDFFSTMGMHLVSGRDLADTDTARDPRVAVVNENFVRYFFGERDPLGSRIGFGRSKDLDVTIVGVVKDGQSVSLRDGPRRFVYLPYSQSSDIGSVTFYVKSEVAPEALADRVREAVARVDPTLPVSNVKTMKAQIRESLFVERLLAALSIAFGTVATLLAALGLYGLMSYAVSMRTREIGIRVALGAKRRQLLTMVLKDVGLLALVGVVLGLPSGYALGRLVQSQLYGLSAADPWTIAVATAILLGVSLVAGYVPASRASRVDPIVALRYE